MDKKLINQAGSKLIVNSVDICSSKIDVSDEYRAVPEEDHCFQSYNHTKSYYEYEDENSNNFIYVFKYSVGIRIVNEQEDEDPQDDPEALAEITATYNVTYHSSEELDEESLGEFAKYNVGYHVWPFWREYVQSSCMRMSITVINVPMYRVPKQ